MTERQLNELKAPLSSNYRNPPFKEAYSRLAALVKANPGDPLLNNFLCEFALFKSNSENSALAIKLWTDHIRSVNLDSVYETRIAEALRDNTFNSGPDKYGPIKIFLMEIIRKNPTDSRIYDLLAKLSRDNHPRISEMVANIYAGSIRLKEWPLEAQKKLDAFLSKQSNNEARLSLLEELISSPHTASTATIEAALELADNSQTKPERALSYLNYLAREKPELLRPYENRLLATIQSTLLESHEGSAALKAGEILEKAPSWSTDKASLQILMNTLISPDSPHGAQRAASSALVTWKRNQREFFNEVFNKSLLEKTEAHASKTGNSHTMRNCRRLLSIN